MARATTNFSVLFVCLGLLLLLGPFLEGRLIWTVLYYLTMTGIFISALLAHRHHRVLFQSGVGLATVAVSLAWLNLMFDSRQFEALSRLIGGVYLFFTAYLFLLSVFKQHVGTRSALTGVLIVYLLLGLAWAAIYGTIDLLDSDAFDIPNRRVVSTFTGKDRETSFSQMVYFSFVTMSTLGYGDMTPNSAAAETATWLQAVFGQFFLAGIVARLVSLLPAQPRNHGDSVLNSGEELSSEPDHPSARTEG